MILKSVNISDDFIHPERIGHFRPTRKSLDIFHAVYGTNGSSATNVVAAYGTGKSMSALVGGLIVECNDTKKSNVLHLADRLDQVEPGKVNLVSRIHSGKHGFVITFEGFVPDLAAAFANSLGLEPRRPLSAMLTYMAKSCKSGRSDRIAIIWDEFGQHLERLASMGRAEDLLEVQALAEWAVRQKRMTVTLTTLLHKGFRQYSGMVSQGGQGIWNKIEGRFNSLHILSDSDELLDVVADISSEMLGKKQQFPRNKYNRLIASSDLAHSLFGGRTEEELAYLFEKAWPITPIALALLFRTATRIGQNNRTMFTFLTAIEHRNDSIPITIEDIYLYFGEAMQTDMGPGGTYRRFLETETARQRTQCELERLVLAGVCLLQLGESGERRRLSKQQLAVAVELGSNAEESKINQAIENLIECKLLLHRKNVDDVSVWHGADIDIRRLINQTASEISAEFNPVNQLQILAPAPSFLSPRYNFENYMTRFGCGEYVQLADLNNEESRDLLLTKAIESDGLVALVVDGVADDIKSLDVCWMTSSSQLILAAPKKQLDLNAALTEACAIDRLSRDHVLLATDPLIEREILELKAAAFEYLTSRLSDLCDPETNQIVWFSGGVPVDEGLPKGEFLSRLFSERFKETPRFRNEQLNRKVVSSQMKSARKRCILGILERTGLPDLGYTNSTSADASIFRTIFKVTGLYKTLNGSGRWAHPDEIDDPKLGKVWGIIREFYTKARGTETEVCTKSFEKIIGILSSAPYGIRPGLLPLLFAAGLRAFGKFVSINRESGNKWQYLDDIQPSDIEMIFVTPDRYEIVVLEPDQEIVVCIEELTAGFSIYLDDQERDMIRAFYDALQGWLRNLPASALRSQSVGTEARTLQRALKHSSKDPSALLFGTFPKIAGQVKLNQETVIFVSTARQQIEQVTLAYERQAISIATRIFGGHSVEERGSLLEAAYAWSACLPKVMEKSTLLDLMDRGIISRARTSLKGRYTNAGFARALSAMILGIEFNDWCDATAKVFEHELSTCVRRIEDTALFTVDSGKEITPLLETKIANYGKRLIAAIGSESARTRVLEIMRGAQ